MQTIKLYERDVTLRSFTAQVLSCEKKGKGYVAVLDATAFFPEGGGQGADQGTLGGVSVLDVHEKDGVIEHLTDGALQVGAAVAGELDADRRLSQTQQHSGEHIVSGIIHRRFGYDNVGFHIGSQAVTLDFNGTLTAEELEQVELEANRAVWANIPIHATYPDAATLATLPYRSKKAIDGPLRIVEVPGYDICACCGTHVRLTGEIGAIKVIGAMNYKGGMRISILCGIRALADHGIKQQNVQAVSAVLSAKPDEIGEAAARIVSERDQLRFKNDALCAKLFELRREGANGIVFMDELPGAMMRKCAGTLAGDGPVGAIFAGNAKDGWSFALISNDRDVRPICRALCGAFTGRGGGKPDMAQGTLTTGQQADIYAILLQAIEGEA